MPQKESIVRLERPDLFRPTPLQPLQGTIAKELLRAGTIAAERTYQPNLAIVVRTKNDDHGLPRILEVIEGMSGDYTGSIETIVVDTESVDNTVAIARDFGAKIVSLSQREFTYPRSLNAGLEAVGPDTEVAYVTVGHAQPALNSTFSAAASLFEDSAVSGVYANALTHESASIPEKILGSRSAGELQRMHPVEAPRMGMLGATNAAIRISRWRERPFDERFGSGGEDTEWGRRALANGEKIIYEPATTVHHSHGLGPVNIVKQWLHWRNVYDGPHRFDVRSLSKRRPDIRF